MLNPSPPLLLFFSRLRELPACSIIFCYSLWVPKENLFLLKILKNMNFVQNSYLSRFVQEDFNFPFVKINLLYR